jgi:polyisoprenyl-teichoic acid--peptidoglycan teichoic acid transferase
MTQRDHRRTQAQATARTRRIQEAARRNEELRARGIDPDAYERAQLATATGRPASVARTRPRRRPPIKAVLLIGLLIVLITTVTGSILLWQRVSAFNDSVSTASAASSALWGPLGGTERVNVVLFGYGGPEHTGGNYLADSIQILSIDPVTDTTTMIPIPRDLWIEGDPEIPDNAKVNEAFAIGYARDGIPEGARLTTKVLGEATGLQIDYWLAIDFTGFRDVVDAVGGVTIDNPTAFSYTTNEGQYHAGIFDGGTFAVGELHLDGEQALAYTRARYTSVQEESSDFARSVRQQRVLGALRQKIGAGGIGSLGPGLAMMDALKGRMMTNLSAIDLFLLSGHLTPDRRIELQENVILEATSNTIGQYILVVKGRQSSTDYRPLQDYLATELAKPIPTPAPSASPSG